MTSSLFNKGDSWRLSSLEAERANSIFEDLLMLCSEFGAPLDRDFGLELQRDEERGGGAWQVDPEAPRTPGRSIESGLLFGTEFRFVVAELTEKFWQRNDDTRRGLQIDDRVREVFPVYRHSDTNPVGFVLAGVGDLAGTRIYPVDVPTDVMRFSVTSFGPAANRVRFLCEIAGIYGDAVRLSSQGIRFRGLLLTTLRDLVRFLGVELSPYRNEQSENTRDGTNDGENSPSIHPHYSTREQDRP